MTEAEIRATYKELHDLLSESYYNFHNISKDAFDIQHAQIWADMESELIASGYLPAPVIDVDTPRAEEILATSPAVITMPDLWELVRIFGRKLDYHF